MLLIKKSNNAAITPPLTGEITQLATIPPSSSQFATPKPPAAIPAPKTPPTIACVVETGAPIAVAACSQIAPEIKAANINIINVLLSPIASIEIIPERTVSTTSPPAINAPEISQTAAIIIAPVIVNALEPTAGPILFATSFAPILNAIYPPTIAANPSKSGLLTLPLVIITIIIITRINVIITPIFCKSSLLTVNTLSCCRKFFIVIPYI